MFCGKCGTQNPDGSAFCSECGAPLTDLVAPASPAAPEGGAAASNKHRLIGMAAVGVAVLVILIVIIALVSGRSANSAARSFAEAVFEGDGDEIVDLIPKDAIKFYAGSHGISVRRAREGIAEEFEDRFDSISELTDDMRFTFKISGNENYGRAQREAVIDSYESLDVKVRDAKIVKLQVSIKYKGEKLTFDYPIRIAVIKVGGSWYVDFVNLDDSFRSSLMTALTSALLVS